MEIFLSLDLFAKKQIMVLGYILVSDLYGLSYDLEFSKNNKNSDINKKFTLGYGQYESNYFYQIYVPLILNLVVISNSLKKMQIKGKLMALKIYLELTKKSLLIFMDESFICSIKDLGFNP